MKLDFNQYQILLKARKTKRFRELDDQVRLMSIELGKGNKSINVNEYKALVKKRDKDFLDFLKDESILDTNTKQTNNFNYELFNEIDTNTASLINTYINKFPKQEMRNVLFIGGTGTRKTYCARYIENKLREKNFNIFFTTVQESVKRIEKYLYGYDEEVQQDFFNSDLLIIDDLGAEISYKDSDSILYYLINQRYTYNKPYLITTNLTPTQLQVRYNQRLFGRLVDKNCTAVITFQGKDLRIE